METIENPSPKKEKRVLRTITKCLACGDNAVEERHEDLDDGYRTYYLKCGHIIMEELVKEIEPQAYKDLRSIQGKTPLGYQVEGANFLEKSNGRALLADEQGLGKTVQALMYLSLHQEMWPFLWIAKASTKIQVFKEIVDWLGLPSQIMSGSSEIPLLTHFKSMIVSADTLARAKWIDDETVHSGIRTIIIDECQSIKNMEAKRTQAIRKLCKGKANVFALSGTPIKNHAGEYFPVLNILRPTEFYGFAPFISEWVEGYNNGYGVKLGGISRWKLDAWKLKTKDFILRRTREEVMPDLPKIRRSNRFTDLGKEVVDKYNMFQKMFEDAYDGLGENENARTRSTNILAYMSKMKHITGQAKVKPCVDFVEEFLDETDRKITIFAHHTVDVIPDLILEINTLLRARGLKDCLSIVGADSANQRWETVESFREGWTAQGTEALQAAPQFRVLVASTLAAGEGINLQFCQDAIMLERQWNPANEEQAEGRFSRVGSAKGFINVIYFVAEGTIDEMLAEIVERKRQAIGNTLDGAAGQWDESSIMQELMQELRKKGRVKRWSI